MPVQQPKTDLSAKKKKLEEMREREKQLALELDLHMKKPTSKKTTPTTPRSGATSARTKSATSPSPRTKSSTVSASPRTKTSTSKSTVKKRIDSNKTSTTPRRKKSKDKTLKEADSKPPAADQFVMLENQYGGNTLIDLDESDLKQRNGFNDTNPFSPIHSSTSQPTQYTSDEMDFFGNESNPFQASIDLPDGIDLNESRGSLQDDVIYEDQQYGGKATSANVEEAEEFYFPEGDEFPEHTGGAYADEFPENENDLFQRRESVAERTQNFEERNNNSNSNGGGGFTEKKEEFIEQPREEFPLKASDEIGMNGEASHEFHDLKEDYYDEGANEEFYEETKDKGLRQQEKIREEIQWDHLRDIEARRSNLDVSYTSEELDLRHSSRSLGRSIQSLDDYDDESEEEGVEGKELSTAEKIKLELFEQNMKERELKEIHRSLSRENLYNYDSAAEETEDELRDDGDEELMRSGNEEQQNTREKILEEMEVLKEREKELKKRQSLYDEPYDSCEEFEKENDYVAEGEDGREEEQVSVMDKIREEMFELETREKELLKKRTLNPTHHRAQQPQDEERNRAASLDSQPSQGILTKKPIFGSRDDLVAFFGTSTEDENAAENKTTKKKSARDKQNAVIIPKVFKKMEARVAAEKANEVHNKPTNQEQKRQQTSASHPPPNQQGRQQKREQNHQRAVNKVDSSSSKQQYRAAGDEQSHQVITKRVERENLVAHLPIDGNDKPRQKHHRTKSPNTGYSSNIKPLTQAWERRGEEEKMKKKKIEREIQQKKEEYLKLLEQKARIEEDERRQQEERIRAYEEKEHQRQLLKQKQHGLNELWLSGKPLVTIDDHEDANDEELLSYHNRDQRDHKQQARQDAPQRQDYNNNNNQKKQQQPDQRHPQARHDTPTKQQQQRRQHKQEQPAKREARPKQPKQQQASTPSQDTPIQINRTIKRWEKIIAKNS
ncbi:glutamic acid-rich protein-like [Clytia hemisphaerica]|uniref:Uncharacterized protein n=1 Tax=Clytia hemisphaerica TaxID=252671 RepID=A0A7M5XGU2_9CNID